MKLRILIIKNNRIFINFLDKDVNTMKNSLISNSFRFTNYLTILFFIINIALFAKAAKPSIGFEEAFSALMNSSVNAEVELVDNCGQLEGSSYKANFNLTSKRKELLEMLELDKDKPDSYHFTYFEDANKTKEISDALFYEYNDIKNTKVIYVTIEDNQKNKFDAKIKLTVNVDLEKFQTTPIVLCANDVRASVYYIVTEDLAEFNSTNYPALEGYQYSFYKSINEAEKGSEEDRITPDSSNSYNVILTGVNTNTEVYIRVEKDGENCHTVITQEVKLIRPPLMKGVYFSDVICGMPGTSTGFFEDLTSFERDIFGQQSLVNYEIYYFTDKKDADNKDLDKAIHIENLKNFEINTNQTIYVRVAVKQKNCFSDEIAEIELTVNEGVIANDIVWTACGENNEAFFDLEDKQLIKSILGDDKPANYEMLFYKDRGDAALGSKDKAIPTSTSYLGYDGEEVYVRVENRDTACFEIVQVRLEVNVFEDLQLKDEYYICVDKDGDSDPLDPLTIDTGLSEDDYSFVWKLDGSPLVYETKPTINPGEYGPGTYKVKISNKECSIEKEIRVLPSSVPFGVKLSQGSSIFSGSYDLDLKFAGYGEFEVYLDGVLLKKITPEKGKEQDESSNDYKIKNAGKGEHEVTIVSLGPCSNRTVIVTSIIFDYPRFFTPNGDGENDFWNISFMDDIDSAAEIYIFDRHGKLLKQLSPRGDGWDGNYLGSPMPSTDYWFMIKYKENDTPKVFKGHFSLIR